MNNIFHIEADYKLASKVKEPTVTQNDAIEFNIAILDGGLPATLDDLDRAVLVHKRSDGVAVHTAGTLVGENVIAFSLGTNETAKPGKVLATVQLFNDEGRVSSLNFSYQVVPDPSGEGYVPSERDATLLEIIFADAPKVIQDAAEALVKAQEASIIAGNASALIQDALDDSAEALGLVREGIAIVEAGLVEVGNATQAAGAAQTAAVAAITATAEAKAATTNANTVTQKLDAALPKIEGYGTAVPFVQGTTYYRNNLVTFEGTTWQLPIASSTDTPGRTATWNVFAARGRDGDGSVVSVNGQPPDEAGNVNITALVQRGQHGGVATGTNNLTVTLAVKPTLTEGLSFSFQQAVTNTGAVTINPNALGAKAILNYDLTPLAAGTLQAGGIYEIMLGASAYILLGGSGGTNGLDQVHNYGLATQAEAIAGTSNEKYMTPLRTAEAINLGKQYKITEVADMDALTAPGLYYISSASTPLNSPFTTGLNAFYVEVMGRGIDSYQIQNVVTVSTGVKRFRTRNIGVWGDWQNESNKATQAQAIAGTDDNTYMTPLRTLDALKQNVPGKQNFRLTNDLGFGASYLTTAEALDSIKVSGKFSVDFNATQANMFNLQAGYYTLEVNAIGADNVTQTLIQASTPNKGRVYTRSFFGTSLWSPFIRQINESNKATQAQAIAGTDDSTYMTPLRTKAVVDVVRTEVEWMVAEQQDQSDLLDYVEYSTAQFMHQNSYYPYEGSLLDIDYSARVYAHGTALDRPTTATAYYVDVIVRGDSPTNRMLVARQYNDARIEWTREMVNGVWDEWTDAKSNVYLLGTVLPTGADLNDYMTPGVYYTNSSAVSASLVNSVGTVGANSNARLTVSQSTLTVFLQRLEFGVGAGATTRREFYRGYNDAWSPWTLVTHALFGSGSPEGVLAAAPSTQYQDVNGPVYTKLSGTGTTGWSKQATVNDLNGMSLSNVHNDEVTIHVSNAGLDSNSGLTAAAPVKTLAKAVELLKNLSAKKRVLKLLNGSVFNEVLTLSEMHGGTIEIDGGYGNNATVNGMNFDYCTAFIRMYHVDVKKKGVITTLYSYGLIATYCTNVSVYMGVFSGINFAFAFRGTAASITASTITNNVGSILDVKDGSFVYVDGLTGANPGANVTIYNAIAGIIIGNKGSITGATAQYKGSGGQIFFPA